VAVQHEHARGVDDEPVEIRGAEALEDLVAELLGLAIEDVA
jgi:hypothetical protein